jgi:hypothetical protein
MAVSLVDVASAAVIPWLGYSALPPTFGREVDMLSGAGVFVSQWARAAGDAVESALLLVLLVVLIRLTLRRTWLVLPVTVAILSLPGLHRSGNDEHVPRLPVRADHRSAPELGRLPRRAAAVCGDLVRVEDGRGRADRPGHLALVCGRR